MNDLDSSVSINERYRILEGEISILQDTNLINRKRTEMRDLIKLCKKSIIKSLKDGNNITGSLERKILLEDPVLRKRWASWAKKRGYSFEQNLQRKFESFQSRSPLSFYVYRNIIGKFGYQPYDLIIYRQKTYPIFIECKASGISLKRTGLRIDACKRRYINYSKSKDKIQELIDKSGSPLVFAFNDQKNNLIYFVRSSLIYPNTEYLCSRNIALGDNDYLVLDSDQNLWPENTLELLETLY
jgi:hypothetical protein